MRVKCPIVVRYAETDQMGIVHHSNYAVWYEVARTELMKALGMSYGEMEQQGLIMPLLELQSKYMSAAYYEDRLIVEAQVKHMSGVKLEIEYAVYREADETPINVGKTIHAIVGKNLKPVNVRREFPEIYQMLLDAVEKPLLEDKEEK